MGNMDLISISIGASLDPNAKLRIKKELEQLNTQISKSTLTSNSVAKQQLQLQNEINKIKIQESKTTTLALKNEQLSLNIQKQSLALQKQINAEKQKTSSSGASPLADIINSKLNIGSISKSAKESAKVFSDNFKTEVQSSSVLDAITKNTGLDNIKKSAKESAAAFGLMDTQVKNTDKSIKTAQKSSNDLFNEIKTAATRFPLWFAISTGFMAFVHAIQDSIGYIADLDKNLTNIQIVTGATADQMNAMANSYNALAQELGSTTNELLKGATEWFRQGKTQVETAELLRSTMMMSKLAAIDSAQATEYLTSTLNGYQLSADKATSVVDKLVAVDNAAATSVAELGSALQRSSNSAQQAGVGLDRLVGYIGVVSSVTRKNAESIGESFDFRGLVA